jgi:hypothetical protein
MNFIRYLMVGINITAVSFYMNACLLSGPYEVFVTGRKQHGLKTVENTYFYVEYAFLSRLQKM